MALDATAQNVADLGQFFPTCDGFEDFRLYAEQKFGIARHLAGSQFARR